jgi:endoglucanase
MGLESLFRAFCWVAALTGCSTLQGQGVVPVPYIYTEASSYDSAAAGNGGERFPAGAALQLISGAATNGGSRGGAAPADAAVSFDGRRVLFSGKQGPADPWQIFEIAVDGGVARCIVPEKTDAIAPFYLPEDRIVYSRRSAAAEHRPRKALWGRRFRLPTAERPQTSVNIPWVVRLPADTPVETALGRFVAAAEKSGPNRGRLREVLVSTQLASAVGTQPSAFVAIDPWEQIKAMRRGVNIIGYDPMWHDFEKARFKERHFQRIHDGGFQTVRINLQAFSHMDSANRLAPAWFKTLDWAVKTALENGLSVILDEHDFNICGSNAEACRPRLMAFWEEVAEHYKDAPNGVTFEILNEPNSQVTAQIWNAWIREALAIIRKSNPARNIIIGPASWNNIHYLDRLELPDDDRNIVVTVHYYLPMNFTHQGARWNKSTADLSGVTWGSEAEKRKIEEDFAGVQQWSKAQNRPILLGEFGAYDRGGADMDSRVRYTSHVARTVESLGWAWTYWQFDSDFIVYDMATDDWVQPIWRALIPK